MQAERELPKIVGRLRAGTRDDIAFLEALQALEAMLAEGWVKGKLDPKKPMGPQLTVAPESPIMEFARP